MIELKIAGLFLAGLIAAVAFFLQYWENHRPKWTRPVGMDSLSVRLRRWGVILLWMESLLIAIGSLLPTVMRSDLVLFVSVWGIVGLLSIVLVAVAVVDAVVRVLARRQRAASLRKSLENFAMGNDTESDDSAYGQDDDLN